MRIEERFLLGSVAFFVLFLPVSAIIFDYNTNENISLLIYYDFVFFIVLIDFILCFIVGIAGIIKTRFRRLTMWFSFIFTMYILFWILFGISFVSEDYAPYVGGWKLKGENYVLR